MSATEIGPFAVWKTVVGQSVVRVRISRLEEVRRVVSSAFAPVIEGIPGVGLVQFYMAGTVWCDYFLAAGIAGRAALVMLLPFVGAVCCGVKLLDLLEVSRVG